MSSYGPSFSTGARWMIDAHQRFWRTTGPVFLRLKNFLDAQVQGGLQSTSLGFSVTGGITNPGYKDVAILPPPSQTAVSQHSIAMSMGVLRFGARSFFVSHTFVQTQMTAQGLTDPSLVWRGTNVVGLVSEGRLYSIVQYLPEYLSGDIISWSLLANVGELR